MQHFSNQIPKIKSGNSLHAYMLNRYECGLVSCALLLFGVDKRLVDDGRFKCTNPSKSL